MREKIIAISCDTRINFPIDERKFKCSAFTCAD